MNTLCVINIYIFYVFILFLLSFLHCWSSFNIAIDWGFDLVVVVGFIVDAAHFNDIAVIVLAFAVIAFVTICILLLLLLDVVLFSFRISIDIL